MSDDLTARLNAIRQRVEAMSDEDVDALFAGSLFAIELGMVKWLHAPGVDEQLWRDLLQAAETNPTIRKIVVGTQYLARYPNFAYWEIATVTHDVLAQRGKVPAALAATGLKGKLRSLWERVSQRTATP